MRRAPILPLFLLGLLSAGLFASEAAAERVYVYRPGLTYVTPPPPILVSPRVDAGTMDDLRERYETTKRAHDLAEDRWEAIEDACEGDDDATAAQRAMASPERCRQLEMAEELAEDRYNDAKGEYFAARSPSIVYDPFWHDTYAWDYRYHPWW